MRGFIFEIPRLEAFKNIDYRCEEMATGVLEVRSIIQIKKKKQKIHMSHFK